MVQEYSQSPKINMTKEELNLLTRIATDTATADDFLALGGGYVKLGLFFVDGPGTMILKNFGFIVVANSYDIIIHKGKLNLWAYRVVSDNDFPGEGKSRIKTILHRETVIYEAK